MPIRHLASWSAAILACAGMLLSLTWIPLAGMGVILLSVYLSFAIFCVGLFFMFSRAEERMRRGMAVIWTLAIPLAIVVLLFLADMVYVATTIQ